MTTSAVQLITCWLVFGFCLHLFLTINMWFIWPWISRGDIHVQSHSPSCGRWACVSGACLNISMQVLFCTCQNLFLCSRSHHSGGWHLWTPYIWHWYVNLSVIAASLPSNRSHNTEHHPQISPNLSCCHSSSMLFAADPHGISCLSFGDVEKRDRRPLMVQGWISISQEEPLLSNQMR